MAGWLGRILGLKFRKRRRFPVKKGLCAVLENQGTGNQIGDIGMGGLSYYYTDHGTRARREVYGMTLVADNNRHIVHLSCKTVGDCEAGLIVSQNRFIKRRCISFQRLNHQQKNSLRHIIRDYTSER